MKRRMTLAAGLFLAFIMIGGSWVGGVHLLPEGTPRTVVMVALGLGFVGTFVTLLAARLRSILAGGRLATELALVVVQLAVMIAGFAAVYQQVGLLDNTTPRTETVHDFWISAYYSVVTFTTLGYGDFYPTGSGRALAALQALTGYVVLGMLASSAAALLSPHTAAGTEPET